ncbi:MAG: hypothetical protein Satyrvirus20_22 [Satyrvirus sp.]|uniref:Uncharacterized protein n=1 Tax=Satyrvirus sp. TaxID=2487771 RepID=A0A3G5AE66_9VIRU|nr:MAG: hypothetical protein Satyrvirus20_22 [Satyrvirus sp.]
MSGADSNFILDSEILSNKVLMRPNHVFDLFGIYISLILLFIICSESKSPVPNRDLTPNFPRNREDIK